MEHMAVQENRLDYVQWLKDPRTQRYLDLTEASLRPVQKPDSMSAARYSGLVDGRYEALRVLTHLDTLFEAIQKAQDQDAVPETYGENEVLAAQWGLDLEKLRQAREKERTGGV